jgi:methyltransferase
MFTSVLASFQALPQEAHLFFLVVVILVLIERMTETRVNKRHLAKLLSKGGTIHSPGPIGAAMLLLHSTWFFAMVLEVFLLQRPFYFVEAAFAFFALCIGMSLRAASMKALGERWTTQISTLPGEPLVESGVYRYLRHPNYLGVILEISALPLLHHAWLTAILYGLLNLLFFMTKIRLEESALIESSGQRSFFLERARLIPKVF